jgi:hypothetical protein
MPPLPRGTAPQERTALDFGFEQPRNSTNREPEAP